MEDVAQHGCLRSDGTGDEVLAGIAFRHLRSQISPVHHHLHQRMILGHLTDAAFAHVIGAAVPHVNYGRLPATHHHRHQRGAHAVEFLELPGLVIHGEVRQLHSAAEHLVNLVLLHDGLPAAADFLHEHVHRQRTGNVSGFGAAHAVADDAQQVAAVKLFNSVRILILFPDTTGIGQSPALHRLAPPFLYRFSLL